MGMVGGLSYTNYADFMKAQTLQKLSGSGTVSIVSGVLADSMRSRQLSDPLRIQIAGRTNDTCVFSIDFVMNAAPNEFGLTSQSLRNVGCFGLFGIVPVQFNNQTTYPNPAITGLSAVLKGYTGSAPTTGLTFTSASVPVGDASYQSPMLITSIPNSVLQQTPANLFGILDNNAGLKDYPGQGWGGQQSGATPLSFRLEITVAPDTGTTIIDFGRFWLGNAFRPAGGVADVAYGIVDPSQLVLSRDNQAFATYFNRVKTLSFGFPYMTELEALGIGTSPRTIDSGDDNNYATSRCYIQAMYALGISKECVAWALDYPNVNAGAGPVGGSLMSRTAVYGHVTGWKALAQVPARKRTQGTQGPRRLWTGGITVQEER